MTADVSPLDWELVERAVSAALAARLCRVTRLGKVRPRRATWAAETDRGDQLIVKVRRGDFADEQTAWTARHLPRLRARGYPAPEILWHGPLGEEWYVLVQRKLRGHPLQALGE